jgi:hypothetical protein
MRKALAFILLGTIGFAGCDKVKDLTNISKELDYTGSVEVPGVPGLPDTVTMVPPGGITGDFPIFGQATDSKKLMEENNTSSDLVTHVNLKQVIMTMAQPEAQTFNYMDSIRVYISAPGVSEQLLGKKFGIGRDLKSVELDPEDINIKEYFLADSIFFRVNAHFIEVPMDGAKMELKTVFNLVGNPLK